MTESRLTIGDKGRVVLPAAIRARRNWTVGTQLVAIENASGVELIAVDDLRDRIRVDLTGRDVVGELIAERRAAAAADDLGT